MIEDRPNRVLVAEIAFPLPLFKTFRYLIPEALKAGIARGSRVKAPFGFRNTLKAGVVVEIAEQTEAPKYKLKEIAHLVDPEPLLTDELLDLSLWLSGRFLAPLGEAISAVFPQYLKTLKRPKKTPLPTGEDARRAGEGIPSPSAENPAATSPVGRGEFELTPSQAAALSSLHEKLAARKFEPVVLFGLPASGKTEVYLRLAEKAVADGGQVLFLVPEISLTHPFVEAFSERLKTRVVTWHSRMGLAGKRDEWLALARGERQVVIGARSASLLPFKDLRLVVVDEEQDESYKQDENSPRYHAREVALERARRHNALLVLGSATPSLETFYAATQGQWAMLELRDRVSELQELPRFEIADKKKIKRDIIGARLKELIADRLEKKEQVILLVNRRGFNSYIQCSKCGWSAKCRSCGISLVHHRLEAGKNLICHHCSHKQVFPEVCPNCNHPAPLRQGGAGTQRIYQLLGELFPAARVLRMDSDIIAEEDGAGDEIVARFRRREADILVGTRLVAKGFHFPDVTLVGVIDGDTPLNMPDFRAAERTFTLLFQAGGRAGRGDKAGLVIVQTAQPDHYTMHALMARDFRAFAATELDHRRELEYPPYGHLAHVVFHGTNREAVEKTAEEAASNLSGHPALQGLEVLGPAPCVYGRLRGRFRYQLLLKAEDWKSFRGAFDALTAMELTPSVRWGLNVDPLDVF